MEENKGLLAPYRIRGGGLGKQVLRDCCCIPTWMEQSSQFQVLIWQLVLLLDHGHHLAVLQLVVDCADVRLVNRATATMKVAESTLA